nr:winged helix-turn-helix domain-containing protein [Salinisphaera halophila]
MRPLLVPLSDERIHANYETLAARAGHFELSEDERAAMLPSGQQSVFVNRVVRAQVHLKAWGGLIDLPARAGYRITPAGRAASSRKRTNRSWIPQAL